MSEQQGYRCSDREEVGRKRVALFRKELGDLWWEHGTPKRGEEDEARSHGGFHRTLHPITMSVTLFPKLFAFPSQLYALGGPGLFILFIPECKHLAQCLWPGTFFINI